MRWLLVAPLLVLLAGCQPQMLDVSVSGTIDNVLISISLPRDLFEFSAKPTDIRAVEVRDWSLLSPHPGGPVEPQPQVWLIQAASCQPNLSQIRYGARLQGFVVRTPPQALREGATYMVGVEGCDYLHNDGIATFKIVHGRAVQIVWD